MPHHRLALLAAPLVLLAACSSGGSTSAGASATTSSTPATTGSHWTYDGEDGPSHWSDLDPDYAACSDTPHQSPIDLPATVPATPLAGAVTVVDGDASGPVADSGHALQFSADSSNESLTYDGVAYDLVQFHAHTPSEHTIDGVPARGEIHLVHQSADGAHTLVLAVLVQEGESSPVWSDFTAASDMVDEGDRAAMTLRVSSLLPADHSAYAYRGSLTTPPCTEDVQWIVFATPVTMTAAELDDLRDVHGANARPVADLGDRTVSGTTVSVG